MIAAPAWPVGSDATLRSSPLTSGASASVTPVTRISAICSAKARMFQMPSYQESTTFSRPLGVQINAAATVMKVRMTAYR